jgi:hypothetical protein
LVNGIAIAITCGAGVWEKCRTALIIALAQADDDSGSIKFGSTMLAFSKTALSSSVIFDNRNGYCRFYVLPGIATPFQACWWLDKEFSRIRAK